ncbi:MAG: hypothetical protein KTV68_15380 [Acidimicrobiia bacterium]|nr:hypothetical protein [Acidimicrobiia bacterium]
MDTTITDAQLMRAWNKCHRGIAELHDEAEVLKEQIGGVEMRLGTLEGKVDLIIDHLQIHSNGQS